MKSVTASVTGSGVSGKVGGRVVALGNAGLMARMGVELGTLAEQAEALRRDGATVLFVGIDGQAAGVIAIARRGCLA